MLETVVFGNTVAQYVEVLVVTLAAFALSKGLYWLLRSALRGVPERARGVLDGSMVDKAEAPLLALVLIISLYLGMRRLELDGALVWIDGGTFLLVAAAVTWLALRAVDAAVAKWSKPFAKGLNRRMDEQMMTIVKLVIKVFVLVCAAVVVLSHLGYEVSALIAGLGVGGLAIALASKSYLEDIVSGVTLFTDKPFKIGDRVRIGDDEGTVVEVGMRTTKLITYDETTVVVPNTQLVLSKITTMTAPTRGYAMRTLLGIAYDTPLDKVERAKAIIKDAISTTGGVDLGVTPTVFFTEFGDWALRLLVRYRISELEERFRIADDVNTKIKRGFEREGIEFAFPTQTVHVKK